MLMWLYPLVILANLVWNVSLAVNALAFSALFILNLFHTGKKLKQPLLASCVSNVCGPPPEKNLKSFGHECARIGTAF
jgi:hypothetical protein